MEQHSVDSQVGTSYKDNLMSSHFFGEKEKEDYLNYLLVFTKSLLTIQHKLQLQNEAMIVVFTWLLKRN